MNLTGWVQGTFLSGQLTDTATLVYLALIPFVLSVSLLLWWRRRAVFSSYVAAMVLTSYAALVTFVLMPTAPPWLGGAAVNLVSRSGLEALPGYLAPLAYVYIPDYFAAFPSLHAAYLITGAYFLFRVGRRLGVAGAAAVAATLFSTLYLGQHYAVDLIGGAAYSLVQCVISERFRLASRAAASPGP